MRLYYSNKYDCIIPQTPILFRFALAKNATYPIKVVHCIGTGVICQQKTHFCLLTKVRFLNDVCLRQMMWASPNDDADANDVCLRAHRGKHRIIAKRSGATSYLRSKCIISPQAMLHCYSRTDFNHHT